MNPTELVKLIEILNPQNKAGRITVIARMGAENMRVKLPHQSAELGRLSLGSVILCTETPSKLPVA